MSLCNAAQCMIPWLVCGSAREWCVGDLTHDYIKLRRYVAVCSWYTKVHKGIQKYTKVYKSIQMYTSYVCSANGMCKVPTQLMGCRKRLLTHCHDRQLTGCYDRQLKEWQEKQLMSCHRDRYVTWPRRVNGFTSKLTANALSTFFTTNTTDSMISCMTWQNATATD